VSKRDYIWVAIRIFGLYLLVHAVAAVPSIISSSLLLHSAWTSPALSPSDPFHGLHESLGKTAASQLENSVGQFVLFTVIGLYLVYGGGRLFRLICPPEDEKDGSQK
jgi:hypothetical protein